MDGGGCAGEMVDNPDLVRLTTDVVQASGGWCGPINFEWRLHAETGAPYLMEANCRLNGYSYLTTMNGVCLPRIVLAHYPDLITSSAAMRPDLYLAGHTHGGQICLPGGRAILTHDHLPRHLCKGAHELGDGTCLVVNRGLGFATIPLRMFCPAEVIEIVLFYLVQLVLKLEYSALQSLLYSELIFFPLTLDLLIVTVSFQEL